MVDYLEIGLLSSVMIFGESLISNCKAVDGQNPDMYACLIKNSRFACNVLLDSYSK